MEERKGHREVRTERSKGDKEWPTLCCAFYIYILTIYKQGYHRDRHYFSTL